MSVVARALFYPSLAYTILLSKFTSRKWYDRVDETVLIGALPLKTVSKKLMKKENIKAVLSMNENHELQLIYSTKEWKAFGVDHMQVSVLDFVATPSMQKVQKAVEFIMSHRENGESVYVHCKAGRTRSATIVVCYLIKVHKWDPDKAYAFLKQHRPHVWLRELQMETAWKFYEETVKKTNADSVYEI